MFINISQIKYFIVAIFVLLISCKTKNTNQNINTETTDIKTEIPIQENQPGVIKAPCGFNVEMNESQIVEYAKNNKKKFFVDKRYAMPALKTKIDGKVYSINFNLYKDKVDRIFYMMDTGFVKMEDSRFKEHYKNVYDMVKELNQYKTIKNTYLEKFNSDFPGSFAGKSIEMASFNLKESDMFECFKITIDRNPQNNTYFIWIEYFGAEIGNYETTLVKNLYFENF